MLLGIFCSLLSGVMLIMSYSEGYTWCSFICLIPLLHFLSTHVKAITKIISIFTFLLLWNLYNYLFIIEFLNNIIGAFSPLVILPLVLLQAIPFLPLILNVRFKYQIFCSLWIILEYAILHSAISTPFSNLGIVASNYPILFQWIQFTGVLGSSLWILLCNVSCLWLIKSFSRLKQKQISPLPPIAYILLLFTPCLYSAISLYQPNTSNDHTCRKVQVLSFNSSESQDSIQVKAMRILKETECKNHTHYVVMPEFTTSLNNTKVTEAQFTGHLKSLLPSYKNNITFVFSASQEAWGKQQVLAIALDYQGIQQRNKELLVPFAEYEPIAINKLFEYKEIRYPTNYISIKKKPTFKSLYDTYHVSICYEALFENFLKRKLQEPNGLLFVLAKEPFDGNMHYINTIRLISKTQAITFQKPLIRSSWGGLSLVINSEGKLLAQSANETVSIDTYIRPNIKPSFYTRSKFNVLFSLTTLSFLAFTVAELKIRYWPKLALLGLLNMLKPNFNPKIMKRIVALLVVGLLTFTLTPLQSCRKDEPEFKDYYLKSQKDVDNFTLSTVNGNLHINGEYISTLSNLYKIKAIKGSLSIYRSHLLLNLDGLHNLTTIDSGLYIQTNSSLENINHLSKLNYVGGNILIFENESLKNLLGLSSLIGFANEIQVTRNMSLESLEGLGVFSGAKLTINGNSSLTSLSALSGINYLQSLYLLDQNLITSLEGLENLDFIEDYLTISSNASLMSIKELSGLTSVAIINIFENDVLETLDGFENISTGLKSVIVYKNSSLTDFCALAPVIESNNLDYFTVKLNKYNPTLEDILNGDCKP